MKLQSILVGTQPSLDALRTLFLALSQRPDVVVPQNVPRTIQVLLDRGCENDISRAIACSLAVFCDARGVFPLEDKQGCAQLLSEMHRWIASPLPEMLSEALGRIRAGTSPSVPFGAFEGAFLIPKGNGQ